MVVLNEVPAGAARAGHVKPVPAAAALSDDGDVDYALTALGDREFEHMVQALVLKKLGARVSVFGDGPDGGREATYTGRCQVGGDLTSETWDGYVVVQAKFLARPLGTRADTPWLIGHLKRELAHWGDEGSRRQQLGQLPEYWVVVTNAVLGSTEGGGIDTASAIMDAATHNLGLKGWALWHHDTLCRLLDGAADVRTAFGGLLVTGDVLAELHNFVAGQVAALGATMRSHAAKELLSERNVRLTLEGHEQGKLVLDDIAVDLPAEHRAGEDVETVQTVAHIVEHGDQVLRPSVTGHASPAHVLVLGGPGQGKTTLSQILTQTYRAELLEHSGAGITRQAQEVSAATRDSLDAQMIPRPRNRRWPIRVDLAAYAEDVAGLEEVPVVRWIARRISDRGLLEVTAAQLGEWLRAWPWLLVLDGLDEVTSPRVREHVVRQVEGLLADAAQLDSDLLVVATTRPQGYGEELDPRDFAPLALQLLSKERAVIYAERLAAARHTHDDELRRQVVQGIRDATQEPLTSRLLRTPLQVTIMSLLLEQRTRLPRDRHGLFHAYFETIYHREANKKGFLAELLQSHQREVRVLHERVGLALQARSENDGESDAAMPETELRDVALKILTAEGHDDEAAAALADKIVKATTDRLVLLVPKRRGDVGYEVRSLQEFMAAGAILDGDDETVIKRLRLAAPAVHWRNTWLLAAGRLFATRGYHRDALLAVLRTVDQVHDLAEVIPSGPRLALDLLDDGVAATSPLYRRSLLAHALELLRQPPAAELPYLARVLIELGEEQQFYSSISSAIKQGLHAADDRRVTALLLLTEASRSTGALPALARQLRATAEIDDDQRTALADWALQHASVADAPAGLERHGRSSTLADVLQDHLDTTGLPAPAAAALDAFVRELRATVVTRYGSAGTTCSVPYGSTAAPAAFAILDHPEAITATAMALLELDTAGWAAASALRAVLGGARQRMPVGPHLLATTMP